MDNQNRRVVITGIGIVSPIGCDLQSFIESVEEKEAGFDKPDTIETEATKAKYCAQIRNFHPEKLISQKSMRRINRFGQMTLYASKLALEDAEIPVPYPEPEKAGLILSSDYGPSKTVNDYMKSLCLYGPSEVSPTLFSQTVMNVAVGFVSIECKLKGVSTLIQGCDGMLFAYEHIRSGDLPLILAGGVDELIPNTFESYDIYDFLAKEPQESIPMGKNSTGTVLGEGACILILEDYEHAKANHHDIYCEIAGIGVSSDMKNDIFITQKSDGGAGMQTAMERAIENAGIRADQIDGIYSCANGSPELDNAECAALNQVFGKELKSKFVVCGKSYYGECFQASNFFNVALACCGIKNHCVYPNKTGSNPLNNITLPEEKVQRGVSYVLCNCICMNGTNVSVILKNMI
jgi:3-oxoacyl-[acyl-carrier-protein] synthase II